MNVFKSTALKSAAGITGLNAVADGYSAVQNFKVGDVKTGIWHSVKSLLNGIVTYVAVKSYGSNRKAEIDTEVAFKKAA